jgi:FG-GAP-like repeat
VLTGDGKGRFAPAVDSPFSLGRMPANLAMPDLNHDGTPDVATTHEASPDISVLLGDSKGGLRFAGRHAAKGHSVAAADFNGDSRDDFAVTTGDGNSILLFFGDAGGNVRAATQPIAVGGAAYRIAAGDFNGDRPQI